MAFLRKQGIRLVIYLDNILILGASNNGLLRDLKTVIDPLQSLGFFINWENSNVIPAQIMKYLGLVVNTVDLSFALPHRKQNQLRKCAQLP